MKVLVADPQSSVRHALSVWINGRFGWDIVGDSSDAFDLLDKLLRLTPDVIIMDSDLHGLSTKDLVARIRQVSKAVAIVLLYNSSLEQLHAEKLDVDFVASKIDPPDRIMDTLLKANIQLNSKSNFNQD